jgi:methylmalonyl-CoA mutase
VTAHLFDLKGDFPKASYADWRELSGKAPSGFESDDGIQFQSLYPKSTGATPLPLNEARGRWKIVQRVEHPEPAGANELVLDELSHGADGFVLVTASSAAARGFGLRDWSIQDLNCVFRDVDLDRVSVSMESGPAAMDIAGKVSSIFGKKNLPKERLTIDFGIDPVGTLAAFGFPVSGNLFDTAAELAKQYESGRVLCGDGRIWHEAGAAEAQEIAFVAATGVFYLRELERRGVPLDVARKSLSFILAADCDQFLTMAKFRALRRVWARIEDASGLEPHPILIRAETSWRMVTRVDPYTNILRNAVATLAAGVAGADIVTVMPHTVANGLPEGNARRLARNLQAVLIDESHVSKVSDPGAGSGAIDAMTEAVARHAWRDFQSIEAAGGIETSLNGGMVRDAISTVAGKRKHRIATRKQTIVGTSIYPVKNESAVTVLDVPPMVSADPERLLSERLSTPFEAIRQEVSHISERHGKPVTVALVNLGSEANHAQRTSFAKSLFALGGIDVVSGPAVDDPEKLEISRQSGVSCVCICGSDDTYSRLVGSGSTFAAFVAHKLRRAGFSLVLIVTGSDEPNDLIHRTGADGTVFPGCDAVAIMQAVVQREDAL